jgi:hypothetical protein
MNIKKLSLQSAVCAVAIFASSHAFAASQVTANASATVLSPISIAKVDDMSFGSFIAGPTAAGTVALTAESTTSRTGTSVVLDTGSPGAAAKFSVTGLSNGVFSITLPTSVTLTTTGSGTMTVDTFTTDLSLTAATLSVGGTADMYVGATLQVGAAQAEGTYTGTFDVSVNYN